MLNVVIVDDEPRARENLRTMIRKYCPGIKILDEAGTVPEAKEMIERLKPDLTFLDIRIGAQTGFQLLEVLDYSSMQVIFTTAYDHYTLRAIRIGAVDYLLKPINPEELISAVHRASQAIPSEDRMDVMLAHVSKEESKDTSIILPVSNGFHRCQVSEIEFIEADRNYSLVHFNDGQRVMVTRSLREWDELLEDFGFLRTHQSFLINSAFVKRFQSSGRSGIVVMQSGSEVEVARTKKTEIVEKMKKRSLWF